MLGVRIGTLLITPYNGERIKVEPVNDVDFIVRVPRAWRDGWLSKAQEINAAVDEASACQPSVPEPDFAA